MNPIADRIPSIEDSDFDTDTFVHAWLLALVAYGIGDVVTTVAIVWFSPPHAEANPVVAAAIDQFGGLGFVGLKLLAFYLALGVSLRVGLRDDDRLVFYGTPLLMLSAGLLATVHNVGLLTG